MGTAWVFGDNVSTDQIIPGRFNITTDPDELKKHAFKYVRPEFASKVRRGDLVLGGNNFGCGSSREHAAIVMKAWGVFLVARSYGWIFKRNCINTGLLPLETSKKICVEDGDSVELDLNRYILTNSSKKKEFKLKTPPNIVLTFYKRGGLMEYLNDEEEYQF